VIAQIRLDGCGAESFCSTSGDLAAVNVCSEESCMSRSIIAKYSLAFVYAFLSALAYGQVSVGTPSFSAYDSHEVDTINLLNNNIIMNIPVRSKAGLIPFSYALSGNYAMSAVQSGHFIVWLPTGPPLAPKGIESSFVGSAAPTTTSNATCPNGNATIKYTNWFVAWPNGTSSPLPTTDYTDIKTDGSGASCLSGSGFTAQTIDGTGLTVVAASNAKTSGSIFDSGGSSLTSSAITDVYGNTLKYASATGIYTDSMGLTVLTATDPSIGPFAWTDVNGNTQQVSLTRPEAEYMTTFGCSGISDMAGNQFFAPSSVSFPDGTSMGITYEATPGNSGYITGRLGSITLREGGTISYAYGPSAHAGMDCTYLNVPVLTRTLGNGDVTTYTLTHPQIGTSGNYQAVNTVIDPGGNKTVFTFTGLTATGNSATYAQVLTQTQRYQGTGTILSTDVYCYNTAFASCSIAAAPTAQVTLPVLKRIVFHQLAGMSNWSALETHYDAYGNVTYSAVYDFGGTTPVRTTTTKYGTCSASCASLSPSIVAIGSNISNKPGEVSTTLNGSTVSQTNYIYDSHGNLLTIYAWTGSQWLSNATPNSYNTNGTPITTYDVANHPTTYSYSSAGYTSCGACTQYPFPTSIIKGGLTANTTYNGTGGVKLTDVDANGNATTYAYSTQGGAADPFWRVVSVTDPLGDTASTTYTPTVVETSEMFGSSTQDVRATIDGYGRPIRTKRKHGSSYNTVSIAYNDLASTISKSVPCLAALGADCTTGFSTTTLDSLRRTSSVVDGATGTLTNTFVKNDIVSTLSPPPSGEHNKITQVEVDGLGRTTSTCSILSSGGSSCGQAAGGSGIVTTVAYSSSSGSTTTTAVRGAETHTTVKDALGRITSQTTPEGGTTTYLYDSWSAGLCGQTSQPGKLMLTTDANGSFRCYAYEFNSLGRVTDVGYGGGTGECRHFRYDSSANGLVTPPGTISNGAGHVIEATTDNCSVFPPTNATIITDEWFSYDKLGNVTDVWQLSPSSLGYLHTFATWFPNGQLNTLNSSGLGTTGGITGIGALTYGLDSDGKPSTLMLGSMPIVAGVTYGPVGPTIIDVGSGTDQDQYTYDPSTGRMTDYKFYVGSSNMHGALGWNTNGTLLSLTITDGFNSGGSQNCAFGYDDVARLITDNCGSVWSQTFSYDQYSNLSKSGNDAWNPGYNTKNQYSAIGATYDASGNLTYDGNSNYTWDAYGKLTGLAMGGSVNCGSSGTCVTYDAFGRNIEENKSGLQAITLFSPIGTVGMVYNYQNQGIIYVLTAEIPVPGGGTLAEGGGAFYLHKDWLGSARVGQSVPSSGNGSVVYDYAFAPYGEEYDTFGLSPSMTTGGFTGDWSFLMSGGPFYETPNRELHSGQGRWLSPDPAGQGWNQYAYATNPNSFVDPGGLMPIGPHGTPGSTLGGGTDPLLGGNGIFGGWGGTDCGTIGSGLCPGFGSPFQGAPGWSPGPPAAAGQSSSGYSVTVSQFVTTGGPVPWGTPVPGVDSTADYAFNTLGLLETSDMDAYKFLVGTFTAPGTYVNHAICGNNAFCTMALMAASVGLAFIGDNVFFDPSTGASFGSLDLAGYELGASWGIVDDTFTMNIWGFTKTADAGSFQELSDALVAQGMDAGASDMRITGTLVTNENFADPGFMSAFANRYGWTYQQVNSTTFTLTRSLP
jgi:RHS repeat-associated protein